MSWTPSIGNISAQNDPRYLPLLRPHYMESWTCLHLQSMSLSLVSFPLSLLIQALFPSHDLVQQRFIYSTWVPSLALAFLWCYVFPIWLRFPDLNQIARSESVSLNIYNSWWTYLFLFDSQHPIHVPVKLCGVPHRTEYPEKHSTVKLWNDPKFYKIKTNLIL